MFRMDADGRIWLAVGFLAALLLAGLASAGETAVENINNGQFKRMEEEGTPLGFLPRVMSKKRRFCSGMHLIQSAGAISCGAIAILTGNVWWSRLILAVAAALIHLTLCQLLPRRVARHKEEGTALKLLPVLYPLSILLFPITVVCAVIARLVASAFGVKVKALDDEITEEDFREMMDAGEESGILEESEKEMISNIFDFDDLTADDVMTHRIDMVALPKTATVGEAAEVAIESGFSRIPVYEDDIDDIAGILYVKDFLSLLKENDISDVSVEKFIHPALFVPQSKSCSDLLRLFTERKEHMAMVVDEYGGTAGLVALEDLIEEIVGNIQDEYDNEEDDIRLQPDGSYLLDGSVDLEEVDELFSLDLTENEDYDTLGGLITDLLGRIPNENEHPSVSVKDVQFTVMKMDDRRVELVHAQKTPPLDNSETV